MTDYAKRVRVAAMLLDRIDPSWWKRVDVDRFFMSSSQHCVLGQVFAHMTPDRCGYAAIWELLERRGWSARKVNAASARLGFHAANETGDFSNYDALDELWLKEIETRTPDPNEIRVRLSYSENGYTMHDDQYGESDADECAAFTLEDGPLVACKRSPRGKWEITSTDAASWPIPISAYRYRFATLMDALEYVAGKGGRTIRVLESWEDD